MYKTTRICKQCGKTFTPEAGRQIFCCPACREKYKYFVVRSIVKKEPEQKVEPEKSHYCPPKKSAARS